MGSILKFKDLNHRILASHKGFVVNRHFSSNNHQCKSFYPTALSTVPFNSTLPRFPRKLSVYHQRQSFSINNDNSSIFSKFWKWTSQPRPPWRDSVKEGVVIFTIFGLAGSSSMLFVKPIIKYIFELDGPFLDSPISYILSAICIGSPTYAMIIFTIGTLAGRHRFFATMATKVIGRFLPKRIREKLLCPVSDSNKNKL